MAAWPSPPPPMAAAMAQQQQHWQIGIDIQPDAGIRPAPAPREDTKTWDEQEFLLEEQLAARGCRGVTHGYARAENPYARALVVGCNYPNSKGMRLWGACADARQWAQTLTGRLGVPASNVALLTDETADGNDVSSSSSSYPSQRNIHDQLTWLTNHPQSGDLLIFVFCGRGTMLLEAAGPDEQSDVVDDEEDTAPVEEGLLCADFDSADWVNGYSMRLLTNTVAASFWESLPRGVVLTVVLDCEHGMSILPVPRRLDSSRLPPSIDLNNEPTPCLEVLAFGVTRKQAQARHDLRLEASADGSPVPSEPKRGGRGSNGVWPIRSWLRGQMLWEAAGGEEERGSMDAEVQAFCLCAGGFSGHAYEAVISHPHKRGSQPQQAKKSGPSQRRGVLTHCALQALEEMNFQGSYYALWWRAIRIMRQEGYTGQYFQLSFSDGTDPTCREVFEPVGSAEARAYARRAELDRVLEDHEASKGEFACSAASCEPPGISGISPDAPLSARNTTCGCGAFNPHKGEPAAPACMVM